MLYMYKFFTNRTEAEAFQRTNGGALYKNTPRSRSKLDYAVIASMSCHDVEGPFCKDHPYVVSWNQPTPEEV